MQRTNRTVPSKRDMSNKNSSSPPPPQPPAPPATNPSLTTTLYHTALGLFALTWSRTLFGFSLHLQVLLHRPSSSAVSDDDGSLSPTPPSPLSTTPSFHLHFKPFIFWNKCGSKKLILDGFSYPRSIQIYWDLSKARFGSGPEPISGFYIAVVAEGEIILLLGDSPGQAYSKTKHQKPKKPEISVLKREHVFGIANKRYATRTHFGGKSREISVHCRVGGDDSRLNFYVDSKRVLQIKHLRWKFRGNERIEVDGVFVQVSWDVYNWLFEEEREDGYALFMFRFEKSGFEYRGEEPYVTGLNDRSYGGFGLGYETKKMKKGLLWSGRSSSPSSLSSASSSCGSVMDWESVEENELKGPSGFSLYVYAWKKR